MHEHHSHEDSQWRSIVKAVSYRVVIVILDFTFIYLFTRNTDIAIGFVVVSNLYTTVAYYLHERIWNKISWGKLHTKA
jgi:adenylylsulfate kinase